MFVSGGYGAGVDAIPLDARAKIVERVALESTSAPVARDVEAFGA